MLLFKKNHRKRAFCYINTLKSWYICNIQDSYPYFMHIDYYKQKQLIAHVDTNDNVLGEIEKWEAHTKGILHRAFTVAIFCGDTIILQHRKHPAFDGYFDMTLSSHQLFENGKLQDDLTAVYACLKREYNIEPNFVTEPVKKGKVMYKSIDPNGQFIEHEMCYLFTCEVTKLPTTDYDYAYGSVMIPFKDLLSERNHVHKALAPWAKEFLKQGLLK